MSLQAFRNFMFFRKNSIGIEIADKAIKIVQLDNKKNVVAYGDFPLPVGIVQKGIIVDHIKFIEICNDILTKTVPVAVAGEFIQPHAVISIPEEHVWTHTVMIPNSIGEDEREAYILDEAAKNIPVDIATLTTSTSVANIRETWFGTFVGVPTDIVRTYQQNFSAIDVHVDFLGSSFYSVARAILPHAFENDNYLIVHVEDDKTIIGVFDENTFAYATMQIDTPEIATHAKTKKVKRVRRKIPKKVLTRIVYDIKELEAFFTRETGQEITKVLLTGTPADMEVAQKQFQKALEREVLVANPFQYIHGTKEFEKDVDANAFANVIGLALYGADHSLPHINLLSQKFVTVTHEAYEEQLPIAPRSSYRFLDVVTQYIKGLFVGSADSKTVDLNKKTKLIIDSIALVVCLIILFLVLRQL